MSYRNPVRAVGVSGGTVSVASGTVAVSSVAGTVDVSGSTVKTEGSGGGTVAPAPAIRGSATASRPQGSNTTLLPGVTAPANVQAGDLLVFLVIAGQDYTVVDYNGDGVQAVGKQKQATAGGDLGAVTALTKVAVASDAGKQFRFQTQGDSTLPAHVVCFALAGAAGVSASGVAWSGSGPMTLYTPNVAQNVLLLGVFWLWQASQGNVTADNFSWGNSAQGGPPSPPPWSTIPSDLQNASANPARFGLATTNWTPAASYAASFGKTGNSGFQNATLWRVTV